MSTQLDLESTKRQTAEGGHYCQGFLDRLFEVENPAYMQMISSSGSPNERRWKKETFACLPSLLLADSSTVLLSLLPRLHSFADVLWFPNVD